MNARELNVTPLMNLFVAIVPLLLLSAVFVSVTSIDLGSAGRGDTPQEESDFQLILRVTPSAWWVDARGETSTRIDTRDGDALLGILDTLRAAHPEHTSVLVACARDVEYSEVVAVLDLAALAGFADCALVGLSASGNVQQGEGS
ncbi:MAG: biopolymer transporter ExbD [Candidatus Latescibacterota bacterium]|nr:MAG: biopolymer transporter ExbD [Candidatus Latescibacterota bacterium]